MGVWILKYAQNQSGEIPFISEMTSLEISQNNSKWGFVVCVCVCVCDLHMHFKILKNACMHSVQPPNICQGVLLQMWHLKTWQIMPLANRKSPRNIFSDYSRLQSLILNCFGKFPKMSFQKWILHFDFEHISESRPPWVNDFNFHW